MNHLDRASDELEKAVRGTLEINAGLESVLSNPAVAATKKHLEQAFHEQLEKFLKSDVFKRINDAIGKAERVPTESDDMEIEDAVVANLPPLGEQKDHKFSDMFADFMILIFGLGGQSFLNKHNIPATFNLKNESIINSVKNTSSVVLSGVDKTTTKVIAGKISEGWQAGLSNAEIADSIRSIVPDTYAYRAEAIVRTETSRMVGQSEHITAVNNGASHKQWTTVGASACPICQDNEAAGVIGIDETFPSGDTWVPAHPNCECVTEYVFTPFMGSIWSGA